MKIIKSLERKGTLAEEEIESKSLVDELKNKLESTDYVFDKIGLILTLVSVIYLLFMNTIYSQSEVQKEVLFSNQVDTIIPFVTLGLVMYLFLTLTKRKEKGSVERTEFRIVEYTQKDLTITAVTMAIGMLFLVFIHNSISELTAQSVQEAEYFMFYVAIAIAEELAFSMLTQMAVEMIFDSWVIGVISRGLLFALFHIAVYGEIPELMLLTFLSGLIFALMLKISKRISANMGVHALVNAITYGLRFTPVG